MHRRRRGLEGGAEGGGLRFRPGDDAAAETSAQICRRRPFLLPPPVRRISVGARARVRMRCKAVEEAEVTPSMVARAMWGVMVRW